MSNSVAAGVSRLSLMNLTDDEVLDDKFILEVYDGDSRLQVEFDDRDHFFEIIEEDPQTMVGYFQNHLFDSPEMSDPFPALVDMAHKSADDGLVTVPVQQDDDVLFDAMTTIFQKAVDLKEATSTTEEAAGEDFLQSMLREQNGE
ncbi:MAG: hypothetical protein ABEK50_17190 [bacterium]